MKRILLIAVLLGTMITATTYFVCIAAPSVLFGKGIKGSGNIVTRTIDAPDFDRVVAVIMVPSRTAIKSILFMVAIILGLIFYFPWRMTCICPTSSSQASSSVLRYSRPLSVSV